MSGKGKWLLSAMTAMLAALVTWVVSTTPTEPPKVDKVTSPPTMEYEGNEISEEVNGVKLWDLTAARMVVDVNSQDVDMTKVVGHFYQADGRSIEFRAEHGVYEYSTKDVHIDSKIMVETSDGARLTSEKLDWIDAERLLIATDDVKIARESMRATGDRAESSDGFRRFRLIGHANIKKNFPSEEEPSTESSEEPSTEEATTE